MRPTMIHYGPHAVPDKNGRTASVTVSNTETAILTLSDPRWTEHSQLSVYLGTIALGVSGGNTKIYLRHYFSIDNGATWKQMPVQNLSSGELLNLPDEITSNTPASVVIDKSVSAAQLYKITGQTDVGTATIADFSIAFRNN